MGAQETPRDTSIAAIKKIQSLSEDAQNEARNTQTMLQAIEGNVEELHRLARNEPQFIDAAYVIDRMIFLQRLLIVGTDEAERLDKTLLAIEETFFDAGPGGNSQEVGQ